MGIDSEGFCFSVENSKLTKQCIKHEVDDAEKFWCIYELLYQLFIWDKGPFKDEILGDLSTMIQKIRDERHRAAGVFVYGIIDTWIYYCMDFCGKPVSEYPEDNKKLNAAMLAASFGFTANIIHMWGGCTGKLEKDITAFFEYEDQKCRRRTGRGLDQTFTGIYRYVLSSLEYLGFRIKQQPNYPSEKLDVACFDYYSLV